MRIILIILTCILLSGCGLFKKSKRVDRSLTAVETARDINVKKDTKQETVDQSKTDIRRSTQSDEKLKIYPKMGTQVKVSPDGSVTMEVDSIVANVRRNADEAKSIANDVKQTWEQKADSAAREEENRQEKKESIQKESEPDTWALFVNKIGWAVGLVVVIGFLLWWFLGRRG